MAVESVDVEQADVEMADELELEEDAMVVDTFVGKSLCIRDMGLR